MDTETLLSQATRDRHGSDAYSHELQEYPQKPLASKQPEAKEFDPVKQATRLLISQGGRLLITILFVVLVILTLKGYENAGNVSHLAKIAFNTILTALSLAFGLNFFDALKDVARTLRWRILADRPFTIREVDLILGGDDLLKVASLMFESLRRPIVVVSCASWIFLNVAAQVGVALITLTASMDSGTNSTGTYILDANVTSPKLDCYYNGTLCPNRDETPMITAHSYGIQTRSDVASSRGCFYAGNGDILSANQTCQYFKSMDGKEFAYRFSDYNPSDEILAYPYLSDRIIKAYAKDCHEYHTNPADLPLVDSQDGKDSVWLYRFDNATYSDHILVPRTYAAWDSTTYVYNGTLLPWDEKDQACGDRCLTMHALRTTGPTSGNRPETFFGCSIHMDEVINGTDAATHNVPDKVARLAIASIALNGRYVNTEGKSDWHSYQLFPWGSDWEIGGLSADEVGARMAEFAIGSIATMAPRNPRASIRGKLPVLGFHLSVHWNYAIALLAVLAGVHTLIFLLLLWLARHVIVIEDSNLCTAKILQNLAGRFEGGKILDEKELAAAIQQSGSASNGKVIYGVERSSGGPSVLGFAEHHQIRSRLPGGAFPQGIYT